ncbi:MAG: hypothetical protein IKH41_09355 [Clostridia bacterium]|nr:hypothetical protein [Clostridia bacterium]
MRKIVPFLIAAALVISMFAIPAAADSSVSEFTDFSGTLIVLWDWIIIDGNSTEPVSYLEDYGAVGGPASSVGISGWTANNTMEITSLGYMIDDGEPVMSADFMVTTDDAVKGAAQNAGCDYVTRFQVNVNVEAITGDHEIEFLIGFEDGSIYRMNTQIGMPVAYTYSADSSAVNATPEPTATPEPSELDNAPGPVFQFNDEDLFGTFFGPLTNQVESVEFDSEKGCYVISMDKVGDPWVYLSIAALAAEYDEYVVDANTYKILQLGVRFPTAVGTRGQFYFQTDENPGIDEAKDMIFDYKKTDEFQYVNINLGSNKRWSGTMSDCRLDPLSACNEACDFEFYYMAFFTNQDAATAFGDKWLASGELDIPTAAPTPTKAPTAEPTATPEVTPTEKVEPTEAAQPGTDKPEEKPTSAATDKPADDKKADNKGPNAGVIIGIVAGVVVIAAAVIGIVLAKKKKK